MYLTVGYGGPKSGLTVRYTEDHVFHTLRDGPPWNIWILGYNGLGFSQSDWVYA